MVRLSNLQTAGLCRELALLLHAGVSVGDGLSLLAQEESAAALRPVLENMAHYTDEGGPLAGAMREAACFPGYVCGLVEVGERSGRTEEALQALAGYYDGREQMDRRIRAALLYPSVLMLVMLVVIVVLLSRVLPVFNDVYASLGGELTGLAGGLLTLGMGLDAAMPVLCVILAVVVITLGVFSVSGGFRQKVLGFWQKRWGDRGIARRLSDARFARLFPWGCAADCLWRNHWIWRRVFWRRCLLHRPGAGRAGPCWKKDAIWPRPCGRPQVLPASACGCWRWACAAVRRTA